MNINSITAYLESESETRVTRSGAHVEKDLVNAPMAVKEYREQESDLSLEAIRDIIKLEFIRFEGHLQAFEADVCKTIEDAAKRVEEKITILTQKIDHIEKWLKEHQDQVEQLDSKLKTVEQEVRKLDGAFGSLEKEVKQQEADTNNIQQIIENLDNKVRKNNLRIKGLKEGAEGENLLVFLEELFTSCRIRN